MPTLFQINVVANWGSTGRIAEGLGQVAMSHGWDSYIAYGRGKPVSQSNLIRIGTQWDMFVHGIATRLFDRHGLASCRATRRLIAQIEEIKPDIIHLHNIHGYYINYKILFEYLASSNIPVVWTLHDCWSFTGHCGYFSVNKCYKWKNGECRHCKHKSDYPSSMLFCRANKNFLLKRQLFTSVPNMTIVTVSDWLSSLVKESFFKYTKVKRIYNGIDTGVFKPQSNGGETKANLGIGQRYMLMGCASNFEPRKGLDDFVRLRKKLPQEDYAIVLVGVSKKAQAKLPQGITSILRTNSVEELADYYSAANVFVNPTWEDNFPTTNLEALACGTPVITYRTGGSPEAIDELTGAVVEQGDIEGLVSAVKQITSQGKNHYLQACRRRAVNLYDKNDRFEEYVQLYESV